MVIIVCFRALIILVELYLTMAIYVMIFLAQSYNLMPSADYGGIEFYEVSRIQLVNALQSFILHRNCFPSDIAGLAGFDLWWGILHTKRCVYVPCFSKIA